MIDFYVRKEDKPKWCRECPLLNSLDECALQPEEAKTKELSFAELYRNCPLLTVEGVAE